MSNVNAFRYGSVSGVVTNTRRAGASQNGNPAWFVTIRTESGEEFTFRTMDDLMLSYAITNAEYRENPHKYGLTRAGRLNGYADRVNDA